MRTRTKLVAGAASVAVAGAVLAGGVGVASADEPLHELPANVNCLDPNVHATLFVTTWHLHGNGEAHCYTGTGTLKTHIDKTQTVVAFDHNVGWTKENGDKDTLGAHQTSSVTVPFLTWFTITEVTVD